MDSLASEGQRSAELPKIAWIYTETEFENSLMIEQMFGNFIVQKAEESGYEVRKVNSWSAYQWLSEKTKNKITKSMQNIQIEEKVNEVLKLALLMEHGGLMFRVSETLLVDGLEWIMLEFKEASSRSEAEVLLFSEKEKPEGRYEYQDFFVAARPRSKLVSDAFDMVCKTIRTGSNDLARLKKAKYVNKEMNSSRIEELVKNIINSLTEGLGSIYYGIVDVKVDVSNFRKPQCRARLPELLKAAEYEYHKQCGKPIHILHLSEAIDRPALEQEMEKALVDSYLGADVKSYWYALMRKGPNRNLYKPLPKR
jgi:hypothetical protein